MPFFGDLLDALPVVGHVKGVLHYVCGDEEGGDKAMRAATRSAAVVGAVTAGALAGPVGAIAAGAAAGAAYDTGTAIVTDGKQVSGVAKIFQNPGEISSWVGAGVDMVGDGLSGIGGGNLGNLIVVGKDAGKKMAKETVKQVLKQETKILAVRTATAVTAIALNSALESKGTESSGQQNSTRAGNTSTGASSARQQSNSGDSRRGDADKGTSREPDDRRDGSDDKKKECQGATTQQLQEFIKIVERIEELMIAIGEMAADFISIINEDLQKLISAAIPLMNDPSVRLTIRGGLLEIVMDNGNLVGISRRQAALLSRAIQHSVSNTSGVDQPCGRPSCRFCPNMRQVQMGWTGNCQTTGAIYSFYCRDCHQIVYAGQTTQPLRNRMTHHLNFEGSPLRRHIANTAGHRNARDLLDMFNIVIMWTHDGVDTELDDGDLKRIIRNWEVFMQWLAEAHKSQGGESKR